MTNKLTVSSNNKTYCLDAATGAHIWSYTTGDGVQSSPAVADGMVFIGSYDKKIYAFGDVLRVPEDYPTVQGAINNATSGATISITPGIYNESVIVNKTLTIIGRKGSDPTFVGGGSGIAIRLLSGASGTTITGIVITNYVKGIAIEGASNCKIYNNIMTKMTESAIVEDSNAVDNFIYGNIFQNNTVAISLALSSAGSTIYNNVFYVNGIGLDLQSGGNTIYSNSFIFNDLQASCGTAQNTWDNGYPSGGNYWSDYTGNDFCSGPAQNESGRDGIGDVPYIIDANNQDIYPLMKPYVPVDLNGDGKIDVKDVVIASKAFGSFPGHPQWNPNVDLNDDRRIDLRDLYLVSRNFGKTYP